jgi:REP element-mobilizing transposase RayT
MSASPQVSPLPSQPVWTAKTYAPLVAHKRNRRSIRLQNFDYSKNGMYFVTICLQQRILRPTRNAGQARIEEGRARRPAPTGIPCFGDVVDGKMVLNDVGQMVWDTWNGLPEFYPGIYMDSFVVMPDHIHGLIAIEKHNISDTDTVGAGLRARPALRVGPFSNTDNINLASIVGGFKSFTTRRYTQGVKEHDWIPFTKRLWQRGFYETIIRNEEFYQNRLHYIAENPAKWEQPFFDSGNC